MVTYPMVPGHELSGVIDAVGSHVDASRIGQRVTIIPHQVCGHCEACKHEIYNFCEELKCTRRGSGRRHVRLFLH